MCVLQLYFNHQLSYCFSTHKTRKQLKYIISLSSHKVFPQKRYELHSVESPLKRRISPRVSRSLSHRNHLSIRLSTSRPHGSSRTQACPAGRWCHYEFYRTTERARGGCWCPADWLSICASGPLHTHHRGRTWRKGWWTAPSLAAEPRTAGPGSMLPSCAGRTRCYGPTLPCPVDTVGPVAAPSRRLGSPVRQLSTVSSGPSSTIWSPYKPCMASFSRPRSARALYRGRPAVLCRPLRTGSLQTREGRRLTILWALWAQPCSRLANKSARRAISIHVKNVRMLKRSRRRARLDTLSRFQYFYPTELTKSC